MDTCIRALVQRLNDAGVQTFDSCCGHGDGWGHVTIGEEDEKRVRGMGFRVCTDRGNGDPEYPFAAVDRRVNVILPPVMERGG